MRITPRELIVIFLALCALAPCALSQAVPQDPRWIVAPGGEALDLSVVVPNSPAVSKSLGDAAEFVLRWQPPASAQAWKLRRPEVERAFRRAIGLEKLPERTPLNARITATHDMGDYVMQNVIFESRPGFPVTANMYLPKSKSPRKRAAVLCPIGHYLAAGKRYPDIQARCIKLAKMGFVVLVYDAIGHGERMIQGNIHHEAGYALLPLGETIAGWMVWDSMRAVDYLLTLKEVDPERIGITGNSGGGLNTLFTAAIDERLRAAVIVGYTFEFHNWLKYAGEHCTCTQLPGLFRGMEWFEIAGLIAPRAVMMLQGERDTSFPISGARRAGRNTETVFRMAGQPERARFVELAGEPHAYSRPYRERMYGWMARFLLNQGDGQPIAEGDVTPLAEDDPRLLCDPRGSVVPRSSSVVELARRKAMQAVGKLSGNTSAARLNWVRELAAPPEVPPHYMFPDSVSKTEIADGVLEKIAFASEDGEYIPGLLWLPRRQPAPTVVMVDDRGKQAVATSGLVEPLLKAGYAVLAVDLRGRGETLGRVSAGHNLNFRLLANQVLFGQPLAGRRAFDLSRAIDYISQRKELSLNDLSVIGFGGDALPALIAAAADSRIGRLAMTGYFHSFVSQMQPTNWQDMPLRWNSAERLGKVNAEQYDIDLGSVIPWSLETADIPDLVSLVAPRRVLFAAARDNTEALAEPLRARFTRALAKASVRYESAKPLDAALLIEWMQEAP
jgi:cephalosporin-C deacetylase-like acetyl esterase